MRYEVRHEATDRNGCDYWSIVDTRNGVARATWTVPSFAYEQALWLNAHAADAPDTVIDAADLAREDNR